MRRVVWSQQTAEGGKRLDATLVRPLVRKGYYREIATLALPYRAEWEVMSFTRRARVTTDLPSEVGDLAALTDLGNTNEVLDARHLRMSS